MKAIRNIRRVYQHALELTSCYVLGRFGQPSLHYLLVLRVWEDSVASTLCITLPVALSLALPLDGAVAVAVDMALGLVLRLVISEALQCRLCLSNKLQSF